MPTTEPSDARRPPAYDDFDPLKELIKLQGEQNAAVLAQVERSATSSAEAAASSAKAATAAERAAVATETIAKNIPSARMVSALIAGLFVWSLVILLVVIFGLQELAGVSAKDVSDATVPILNAAKPDGT